MKILLSDEVIEDSRSVKAEFGRRLNSGKVRIDYSQMRGGMAIFISGRMEGPLFLTEDEAQEWIDEMRGYNE